MKNICGLCEYFDPVPNHPTGDGLCFGDVPQIVVVEVETQGFDPKTKMILPPSRQSVPMPMRPMIRPDLKACRHFKLAEAQIFKGDPPRTSSIWDGIKKEEPDDGTPGGRPAT